MADEVLPPDLRHFIARHLSSVEHLEILRLLASQPRKPWTLEAIYGVVLSSRLSVAAGLSKLAASGLVRTHEEETPAFIIANLGSADARLVDELMACYRDSPVRVISAIYQPPPDPIQGFADAFRFKQREP
jgi:hypothetical protein